MKNKVLDWLFTILAFGAFIVWGIITFFKGLIKRDK